MILSVIIPVFNEEKTIKEILRRVLSVRLPEGIKKEIIVVDDGSTDSSKCKVQSVKCKAIKLISHEKNKGKGAAVRAGLECVTGDYIIIQDGDLEYDPKDYVKLLRPMLQRKSRVVFGSRLVNYPLKLWGSGKTVLPLHLIANRFLTALVNILCGSNLTDMETCYKLFGREVLKKINLESDGFEIEPEVTIKTLKSGYGIFEVPIKVKPRTYSQGKKIGVSDGVKAIWAIFRYRFLN